MLLHEIKYKILQLNDEENESKCDLYNYLIVK